MVALINSINVITCEVNLCIAKVESKFVKNELSFFFLKFIIKLIVFQTILLILFVFKVMYLFLDRKKVSEFSNWLTWCQTCRHGGHSAHLLEWFQ